MSTRTTAPIAPLAKFVPHEVEAVLTGSAEEVEDQVVLEADPAEVHCNGRGGLAGVGHQLVDADAGLGHDRFAAKRFDLGDGSDEGGLAHAEATGHDDLDGREAGLEALDSIEHLLEKSCVRVSLEAGRDVAGWFADLHGPAVGKVGDHDPHDSDRARRGERRSRRSPSPCVDRSIIRAASQRNWCLLRRPVGVAQTSASRAM